MRRRDRFPRATSRGVVSNGLAEDVWVPVWCVDRRIVDRLLAELAGIGVPAYCSRLRGRWLPPVRRSEWCLWVGQRSYDRAEVKLAEILPALVKSLQGGAEAQ